MNSPDSNERILSIDIGGSHIKATILDGEGKMLSEYKKIETPSTADPEQVMQVIVDLTRSLQPYTKASVGFPGYISKGTVYTAPNLAAEKWKGIPISKRLSELLKCPVRSVNDADMQGLGIVSGKGFEMVLTLGTGFGTALLMNGNLLPHLELAHHPVSKDRSYDEYVGEKALEEAGPEKWNKRIENVIDILKTVFHFDHLYIGGGNARKINFTPDGSISLVSNMDGIRGGAKLWQNEDHYNMFSED
jgi:polyphosphate glucokinase